MENPGDVEVGIANVLSVIKARHECRCRRVERLTNQTFLQITVYFRFLLSRHIVSPSVDLTQLRFAWKVIGNNGLMYINISSSIISEGRLYVSA